MKKYGNILIENVPNESTQFLKALCTNYKSSNKPLVDQVCMYLIFISFHLFQSSKIKDKSLRIFLSSSFYLFSSF